MPRVQEAAVVAARARARAAEVAGVVGRTRRRSGSRWKPEQRQPVGTSTSRYRHCARALPCTSAGRLGLLDFGWQAWVSHNVRVINVFLAITAGRHDEARRRREEKKLQRQKELELRRASRTSTGPMKLGAKKMWMWCYRSPPDAYLPSLEEASPVD